MNLMRFRATVALLACSVLIGCSSDSFDFEGELQKSLTAYNGSDETIAKGALTSFVQRAERHEKTARNVPNLDYDRVLAIAWLELASIYELNRNEVEGESAFQAAIRYFDRVEQIAGDPRYKKDKRAALREFLQQTESYQTPEWKRQRMKK